MMYSYTIRGLDDYTKAMGNIEGNTSGEVEQWVRQTFFDRWGYRCTEVNVRVGEYDAG